ncbi:hypothetical protein ACRQ5Q_14770 [Bradyrhizobium sp. PMVTL-01]|uniref:hypothetical protein n=1 Tax=Bradyrhizobium sp. PMVTL-01 TaxID=3434999 RepID=UPI003F70FFD5
MTNNDTSSVYNINMLDDDHRANFSADKPWVFETAGDLQTFASEADACKAQRHWREFCGFDPATGERVLEA